MLEMMGPELIEARTIELDREAKTLQRRKDARGPGSGRGRRRLTGRGGEVERRRTLFAEALESAQREGITIDAWFGFKFADPELSARADWAGLTDEVSAARKSRGGSVWAA